MDGCSIPSLPSRLLPLPERSRDSSSIATIRSIPAGLPHLLRAALLPPAQPTGFHRVFQPACLPLPPLLQERSRRRPSLLTWRPAWEPSIPTSRTHPSTNGTSRFNANCPAIL